MTTLTVPPAMSPATDPRLLELDEALANPRLSAWADKLTEERSKLLTGAARQILGA